MSGRYAMKVDIGGGSLDPLQFFHSFLKLEHAQKYYISFMAKAAAPRPMTVGLEARDLETALRPGDGLMRRAGQRDADAR
jgi:hypothetical protein